MGVEVEGSMEVDAEVITQGGALRITGKSEVTQSGGGSNIGVDLSNGALVGATATGHVSIAGTGGVGSTYDYGLLVALNSQVSSAYGSLTVSGKAGGESSGKYNTGVVIDQSSQVETEGDGAVTITGTGGVGTRDDYGIWMSNAGAVTSGGADIALTGTGGTDASSSSDMGVRIEGDSYVSAVGSGTVTVKGTGGEGSGGTQFGVYLYGGNPGDIIGSVNADHDHRQRRRRRGVGRRRTTAPTSSAPASPPRARGASRSMGAAAWAARGASAPASIPPRPAIIPMTGSRRRPATSRSSASATETRPTATASGPTPSRS